MKNLFKRVGIIILIFCSVKHVAFSQTFFKDYKKYQLKAGNGKQDKRKINLWVDGYLKKFKTVFNTVKRRTGIQMLNCDTLYILNTFNDQDYDVWWLIWNKKHSCYYQYNAAEEKMKNKDSKTVIEDDAVTKLNMMEPGLRKIVESADTTGYFKYIESNPLPDYHFISFVIAIRKGKNWKFVSSKTYGTKAMKDRS